MCGNERFINRGHSLTPRWGADESIWYATQGIVSLWPPHPWARLSRPYGPNHSAPIGGREHSPGMSAAIPWDHTHPPNAAPQRGARTRGVVVVQFHSIPGIPPSFPANSIPANSIFNHEGRRNDEASRVYMKRGRKLTTPAIPFQGRAPWALFAGVEPLNLSANPCYAVISHTGKMRDSRNFTN